MTLEETDFTAIGIIRSCLNHKGNNGQLILLQLLRSLGRRCEESSIRVLAELMAQDAESAWAIAEAPGRLGRAESLDEIGPQGFVLPVGGVLGHEEDPGVFRYVFWCIIKHISTMSP